MTLDFGGVLSRAWKLIWNNKILWLFGILSGLIGGQVNGSNSNFRFDSNRPEQSLPVQMRDLDPNIVLVVIAGVVLLIIVIAIVLFILGVFGRGGLIGGVRLADKQGRVSFGEAWAVGRQKFWTVLAIGLAVWVLGLLLAGVSLVAAATICLLPLACIGFLLIPVLGVYARLAQVVSVSDEVGVSDALSRAWRFITTNLASVIIMGLILVIIQAVIGFVVSLPFLAIAAPILFSYFGYANNSPLAGGAGLAVAGLCVVVYIPVLIVIGGIVESWVMAAWTLTYQQLTGRGPAPVVPAATPA